MFDENFDAAIVSGLTQRVPSLEFVTVQGLDLRARDDDYLLDWAAEHAYLIVTHDQKTMPRYCYERMDRGKPVPGVVIVPSWMSIGAAIEELHLLVEASQAEEWEYQVIFLPLK